MQIQAKGIIFRASVHRIKKKKKLTKKLRTNEFLHIRLLLLIILFLLLGATTLFFHNSVSDESFPERAFSQENSLAVLPSYLAPSPTATPTANFSLFQTLNASAESSTVATTSAQEDYCLDVPVILYHHVQPLEEAKLLGHAQLTVDSTIFDSQMQYLVTNGYTAITADALVDALLNHQPLPQKSIVITLDDGYADDYTYAFLAAKKYHVIMNFMIPTSLIGGADYMTWDHLREMAQSPYARIYNHTATHAPLGLINKDQIDQELATSSAAFKEQLNMQPDIFTYPYGSYSDLAIQELQSNGFIAAFTTDEGRQQCASTIMKLQRNHIGNAPLSEYGL